MSRNPDAALIAAAAEHCDAHAALNASGSVLDPPECPFSRRYLAALDVLAEVDRPTTQEGLAALARSAWVEAHSTLDGSENWEGAATWLAGAVVAAVVAMQTPPAAT